MESEGSRDDGGVSESLWSTLISARFASCSSRRKREMSTAVRLQKVPLVSTVCGAQMA